jgi:uncharacterized protein (DUF2237 family)
MISPHHPTLSPQELYQTLQIFIPQKLSIFILGDPGQGKTEITRQAAAACNADFVPVFLAIKDPTDIGGYPSLVDNPESKYGKDAVFMPFGDMKKLLTAEKLTVCFADDLGISPKLMQGAWMQCVCEREINGHKISDNVMFISASNLKGGNTGVTTILDPLMNKHTTCVHLKNTFEDWCMWAVKEAMLPYEIIYFVRWQPEILNAYKSMPDLSQTPTARGIEHCAQIYKSGISESVRARLFAGAIGEEYAVKLEGFLKFYKNLPNPDMVIADPEGAEIPKDPGQIYALCAALAQRAKESSIDAIITYANRLTNDANAGAEFSVALVCDSVRKDPQNLAQGNKFIEWSTINHDVLI